MRRLYRGCSGAGEFGHSLCRLPLDRQIRIGKRPDRVARADQRQHRLAAVAHDTVGQHRLILDVGIDAEALVAGPRITWEVGGSQDRSEEHTSELQSLMRISYAVFCLKKKKD